MALEDGDLQLPTDGEPALADATPDPRTQRYQQFVDAAAVEAARGHPGLSSWLTNRAQKFAGKRGLDVSGITPVDLTDPNMDVNSLRTLRGTINKARTAKGNDVPLHASAFNNFLTGQQTQNRQAATNQWAQENIEPGMNLAQRNLTDLASTPAFSGDFVAKARSNLSDSIKGAEENRLRRVSAVLGLRGMDPSSPAGATLAARTALQADAELGNALNAFDMKVETGNRDAKASATEMLSRLSMAREVARRAAASGDMEALYRINQDISSVLEAIRQQEEMRTYQADLMRDANSRDWLGTGIGLVSSLFGGGATADLFTKGGGGQAAIGGGGTPSGNLFGSQDTGATLAGLGL